MFPVLQIGPLAVQVPGFILLGSIWLGLLLVEKNAKHHTVDATNLYNLILITLISGIVGARITYILRYPGVFAENPISTIALNTGLLDPVGGAAVGVVTAIIYGQRKHMPLFRTLDALVPLFAIVYIGYALANTASGNGYGNITDMPWGIESLGAKRHPVQIYHVVAGIAALLLVWPNRGPLGTVRTAGVTFFAFIGITAGTKILLDAYQASFQLTLFGARDSQLAAWLIMAISLVAIGLLQYGNRGDDLEKNPS